MVGTDFGNGSGSFFLSFIAFEKPTFHSLSAFNESIGDYALAERCASVAMNGRI